MERLEKLINILKLTPHRQPELVKEATHRILSKPIRTNNQSRVHLKPLIEILISYCDTDDSAQRSLFNDHLNSVVLAFQNQNYSLILHVLVDTIVINGSARSVTAALQRIPYLIVNVQPIELGCDPQKLLKALIEVARRTEDESVLRSLDHSLEQLVPFFDFHVRKSKEMQLLSNSLTEVLIKNLQDESSNVKRIAASSISTICNNSELIFQNTLVKLRYQLQLSISENDSNQNLNRFIGFCLCAREIPKLMKDLHDELFKLIIEQLKCYTHDITVETTALETIREILKYEPKSEHLVECAQLIIEKFLVVDQDGVRTRKENVKVILQSNALACLAIMINHKRKLLDINEYMCLFRHHSDIAVRNQVINMIGIYINASWRFPNCIDESIDCERIRKLWVDLRATLDDTSSHPDVLKACVIAIKTCLETLLESDHCLHIIEFRDFNHLIELYLKSNFKPLKVEILNLFAKLNYRTLNYLEKFHWSKMRPHAAGSHTEGLQDKIVNTVLIPSLVDDHQRVRSAAAACLVAIVPNLYVTTLKLGHQNLFYRTNDPLVSLAHDFASEHLIVLRQAEEHINHFTSDGGSTVGSDSHEKLCIRNDHKFLSSSIIQSQHNPYNEQDQSFTDVVKSQHRVNVAMNLTYIVGLLKFSMENGLERGKVAISSIVRTLYELSVVYPVYQYSASWDCRASEYCECFTLLNFLLSYMENLVEPDIVVEDLESYKTFLELTNQLMYALCHESVINDYEHQKMKPFHKRQAETVEGHWSELRIKHSYIADTLEVYFTHLVKLLCSLSHIIEEKGNPAGVALSKHSTPLKSPQVKLQPLDASTNHRTLMFSNFLLTRIYKKLESSLKSSKKNLNIRDEKFYQILNQCLSSLSSLMEFIGMQKSMEHAKDILGYLKTCSPLCGSSSLVCARQLLKSLFGINILALYQVDPHDWFEEDSWSTSIGLPSGTDNSSGPLQGVYYQLILNPYRTFSNYCSINYSRITPTSDKALAIMNFESRRALKVRRRIEDRVKSLFEFNPQQLISIRVRQLSEVLKNTITEFTPIVTDCMTQFESRGFSQYQSETLHFMSYLILLRVNFQKLTLAGELVNSVNKLLDQCGEKVYRYREANIEMFLRNSFTFLTLLSHDREFSKPMFPVATVIQKLDDVRAKLSMNSANERDVNTYVVPLLRSLVEDLFIYRTKNFQNAYKQHKTEANAALGGNMIEMTEQDKKDEILEAERETVAQKLLDVIDNPKVYDLLSILVQESRQNPNGIKYKKLSQHLLSIIPTMLARRQVNLVDYRCIELTRRIIENISPEVFNPVGFIIKTLLEAPKPSANRESDSEFQRWMSLVIIAMHILITQVNEEVFLNRLNESMTDEVFVEYLLHIAQLCIAEIVASLYSPSSSAQDPKVSFLVQQLSCYILYLTRMFQSGLFYQLSQRAMEYMKKELEQNSSRPRTFKLICDLCRDPSNGFSLNACEALFFHIRLVYPDLTIFWCNIMMLLNNVDCNRDYWRNLLVYECHHCQFTDLSKDMASLSHNDPKPESEVTDVSISANSGNQFKRSTQVIRPSSLNLSDISFSDQLRRSFIKRIAAAEPTDKALNRNIVARSNQDGQLLEQVANSGNTEQCLSLNIELTRRGALCLILDFVTISMNDVEHITWLIIHHINDIIRWSHETPITEFIGAVHRNSASSGIFIQAINNSFTNLTSISFVSRVLWTLHQVHYTQYGSLVVLMIEKLLSSSELSPYRSVTRKIEDFTCELVQKLLDETNKSLATTSDEVLNQLTVDDLDRVYSLLEVGLYPSLTELLVKLRETTCGKIDSPKIELHHLESSSEDEEPELSILDQSYEIINGLQDLITQKLDYKDPFKMESPIPTHEALTKDPDLLDTFCDHIMTVGWSCRRQFEEAWVTLLGVLSASLAPVDLMDGSQDLRRKSNLRASCMAITTITKLMLLTQKNIPGDPLSSNTIVAQNFEDRVIELTKSIGTNLSSLRKRTKSTFEMIEVERNLAHQKTKTKELKTRTILNSDTTDTGFSDFLRISAQKIRMNVIINPDLDLSGSTIPESDSLSGIKSEEVDVESCIRLLLDIYRQELQRPSEGLTPDGDKLSLKQTSGKIQRQYQIAPPLITAIAQSVLALSDMFTGYEQYEWMFEGFVQMFKQAERNEDEIQMQYLIVGLCKSASICCYDVPTELTTSAAINHKEVMFEKCRQTVEKCIKSDFGPLKRNALFGLFYMLEDSVNIVASGAWELDQFRQLRQSRLSWITKLMPIILDKDNCKVMTNKAQIVKLLESLCEVVTVYETKHVKA